MIMDYFLLPGMGSKDMGRQLLMVVRSPLLGMGMTFAADQEVGNTPLVRQEVNRFTISGRSKIRASFRTVGFMPSTPDDFDVSMFLSKVNTMAQSILIGPDFLPAIIRWGQAVKNIVDISKFIKELLPDGGEKDVGIV